MKTRGKRHFLVFNIHTHPGDFFSLSLDHKSQSIFEKAIWRLQVAVKV